MLKIQELAAFIWSNLGYCPNCMRKAFLTALIAWGMVVIIALLHWSVLVPVAIISAVGLTTLWVAHLVAFDGKATVAVEISKSNTEYLSRRTLLPIFVRALAFAAFASSMSRSAFAESPCGGWDNLPCGRCQRRNTVSSPCEYCHSCGSGCPQDNSC